MRIRTLAIVMALFVTTGIFAGCRKAPAGKEVLPPPKIIKKVPTEVNPLRKTYEAEEFGKEMSKGQITADPAASNQMALYIKPGDVKPTEYVVWGPYEEIAPGTYIARWRLKLDKLPSNSDPILSLDVSGHPKADANNYKMLVSKPITKADAPDPKKYYTYDIRFEVKEPFVFELRTQYLQNSDVYIDWTSLELAQ